MEKFEEAGFENITLEVEYDIITGRITDDGEVKSVTVKMMMGSLLLERNIVQMPRW